MTDDVKDETHPSRIGGSKGISAGRPKGAKNKSTLLRLALTEDFDKQLEKDFKAIIRVVAEQAKDGCRQSQKLLIDRVIPSVHAESDKGKDNKFSGVVHVHIGSLEDSQSVQVSEEPLDGEFEEVEEDS